LQESREVTPASSSVDNTRNSARQRDSPQGVPEYHCNRNEPGGNLAEPRVNKIVSIELCVRYAPLLLASALSGDRKYRTLQK
jgi:hypothetical protein